MFCILLTLDTFDLGISVESGRTRADWFMHLRLAVGVGRARVELDARVDTLAVDACIVLGTVVVPVAPGVVDRLHVRHD